MRKEKEVLTKCVSVEKVKEVMSQFTQLVTEGRDRVWVSKGANGELNFILNGAGVQIKSTALKGGTICL